MSEFINRAKRGGKNIETIHDLQSRLSQLQAENAELKKDCIERQQEINCLRMEPCQLPQCARYRQALENIHESVRWITEPTLGEGEVQKAVKSALHPVGTEGNTSDLKSCNCGCASCLRAHENKLTEQGEGGGK